MHKKSVWRPGFAWARRGSIQRSHRPPYLAVRKDREERAGKGQMG